MTKRSIARIATGIMCAAVAYFVGVRAVAPVGAAGSCESLMSLKLPATTITRAEVMEGSDIVRLATGPFRSRAIPGACRVAATLRPSSDSEINMEIWMPVSNWNGKYQAVGNGAFNGTMNFSAMTEALSRGYATSSTDTGHTGSGAAFALGHPEKVIDFGWRAVHETAQASKRIVDAYYGKMPAFSYFNGCSAGGRQAMQEAQRFPADFNGIIAGAPGLDWTGRAAQAVRIAQRLERHEAARLLQPQRQLLHDAVDAACDLGDGVKDGVIGNPARCTFDPAVLQCKNGNTTGCLSTEQVETARMIYSSAVNRKTSRALPVSRLEARWMD